MFMSTRPAFARLTIGLSLILPAALIVGCGSPKSKTTKGKTAKVESRETVGKTTQNVLKLADALAEGGVLAATNIEVADPLTQSAAAYRTSVGKIGAMAVQQTIAIRNAQNIMEDPKPLTHEVFLAEILKKGQADGMQLAMLPYYQEYAWDEAGQKLVVVEFPKRKEGYQKNLDEKLGRN